MEDPIGSAPSRATLRRACESNRLAGQLISDAYECLLPVVRYRGDEFCGGAGYLRREASDPKRGMDSRLRYAGGGS